MNHSDQPTDLHPNEPKECLFRLKYGIGSTDRTTDRPLSYIPYPQQLPFSP